MFYMPQSMTNFDANLKDNYGPGLKNAVNNSSAFISEVKPETESIMGRKAVWSIHTGRSASTGNRGELVPLPVGDRQRFSQVFEDLAFTYHTIKVSGPAKHLTKGDEGAFARALETELEGAEKDIKNDYSRQAMGQALTDGTVLQTGVLAVLSADPGTGTTLTMSTATKAEMRYFFIGMVLQLINPSGGAARTGTYTVSAVNASAKTLTIAEAADAGIASGDYVVRNGNFGQEINGLRHLISANTFAGINPATVPQWGSVLAGSSSTAISEVLLNEASEKVMTDGDGSTPDMWVAEFDQVRKLASQLQAQKRYDGMKVKLESGWSGLDIAEGTLVRDRYCPTNDIFGMSMKDIRRFVGLDFTWDDDGGPILRRSLDSADAVEATFKAYHNLVATNRNSHVRVTVSTPTF